MRKMTKAAFIRTRIRRGLSNRDIAAIAKCGESYVRAVRQRTDDEGKPRWSACDRRYDAANRDARRAYCRTYLSRRYHSDAAFRQRKLALARRRYRELKEAMP